MDDNSVIFKGTVNGLTIIMKEEEDFETIYNQIEKKVASAGKFFKNATLYVKYRGKKLKKDEENKIFELMSDKSGAEIKSFDEDTEVHVTVESAAPPQPRSKTKIRNYYFRGIDEGITKFYRGTVRSGQLINFDGNLVIIGDINPGGEIIATGNVTVMGSLRGIVHAGSDGNKDAIVVALNLQPMQLRIADVITRSPDEKEIRNNFVPELAFIKDDMVYIERFLPQR